MKLADRTIETHSVGVASKNQFNIAQTSKMFKILSDSLYSDKVMAAIRELSTNAYDSHISAGNKNPFKVTLPTAANPTFVVRDYGTGLSQLDMENLYTTYGASNKNDSNDFVGCLGLGSKSPFAYTKSFTTESYYNGKKYTYIAAIDESGVPTLNLFNTSNTKEPNGLEISFAVKQHDFQEFTDKAKRIFHYFKMKPIVEGGIGNNLQDHKYSNTNIIISGAGWRVCRLNSDSQYYPNNFHRIDSGIVAIMGNIAYPVQTAQIVGQEKEEMPDHIQKWNRAFQKADIDSWKSFVSEILNSGLYLELDFNIGQLEMDVAREGLQYTKDVIKTLRKKTQEIYMEMKEEFSKKIQASQNKVDAITSYYTMNELAGGWGVGATWTDPKGKDHPINSGNDLEYKILVGKSLYVFNYKSAGYRSRRLVALTDRIHHETLTGKGYNYWNNSGKKKGKITFFVCDVKGEETAKKIVTKYCNTNDCFAYLMIDTKDHTKSGNGFDQLIEDVGPENLLKVSDYKHLTQHTGPRKVGAKNSKGSVSDQDVFFIHGYDKDSKQITNPYNDATYLRILSEEQLENFLEQDEIVYVPMLRYGTEPESGCPAISSITRTLQTDILKSIVKDLVGNSKIYAIKTAFIKKLEKDGYNLVNFNDFLKRQLKVVAQKHFKNLASINKLVEYCKKDYATEEKNGGGWRHYQLGTTDKQFMFHILNIFGLDYDKFIHNKTLVDCLNKTILTEFFANTVHLSPFNILRFNQTEYLSHISKLMKEAGIEDVEGNEIRNANLAYNTLTKMISYNLYSGKVDEAESYLKIIRGTSTQDIKTWKISEIREKIKTEVDKNTMLKVIMGNHQVS
jgi:hypothetical protein